MAIVDVRFEALVLNKDKTRTKNKQNRHVATTLINMSVNNLLLNNVGIILYKQNFDIRSNFYSLTIVSTAYMFLKPDTSQGI